MTTFTMRLKDVLEQNGGAYEVNEAGLFVLTKPELIGLAGYPIFDESHREVLNSLIFTEYMNQEIAHETDAIFRARVRSHMAMFMPIFNKMYKADALEIDPLSTMKIASTSETDSTQEVNTVADSTANTTTTSKSRAVSSDFPQSQLAGDADYASSGADTSSQSDNDATNTQSSDSATSATGESRATQEGYTGHAATLLQAYRDSLASVDAQIVLSLQPFFMMVVDTPNSYTRSRW